jgi:hypothetical protein
VREGTSFKKITKGSKRYLEDEEEYEQCANLPKNLIIPILDDK